MPTNKPKIKRRKTGSPDRQLRKRGVLGAAKKHLPLIHVTAAWSAKEIIKSGQLQTSRCKVFDKDLLYFFVLRPAYRMRDGDEKSHQINRFPTVLVVNPDAVPDPFHAFPFDTGGAIDGAFDDQADPYIPLEDYELEPSHEAALAHISWAFGTSAAYYDGLLRNDILNGVPRHEAVTRGYVDIAVMGKPGSNRPDKRALTVELACSHNIQCKGNVLLAVLPKQFLDDGVMNDDLLKMIAGLNIEARVYDWQPNTTPNEFQEDIERIVREWLTSNGAL